MTYSSAVLQYLIDPERDVTIPAGVAVWSNDGRWFGVRLPKEEEQVPLLPFAKAIPALELVQGQIAGWVKSRQLPYAPETLAPLSAAWWEHAQKLLQFRVRLDAVHPLQATNPEEELETLFEAAVQPHISQRRRAERVDSAVTVALGNLTSVFQRHIKVAGFGGRPITVLRGAANAHRVVVVEAVNLSTQDAEGDADALYGRLSRIREGQEKREVRYILGYLASSHGLNGERALKEFIEANVQAPMYDLAREREQFQNAALREGEIMNSIPSLFAAGE